MHAAASLPDLSLSPRRSIEMAYDDPIRSPAVARQRMLVGELRAATAEVGQQERAVTAWEGRRDKAYSRLEEKKLRQRELQEHIEHEKMRVQSRAQLEELVVALGEQVKSLVFQGAGIAERARAEAHAEAKREADLVAHAVSKEKAALKLELRQARAGEKAAVDAQRAAEEKQKVLARRLDANEERRLGHLMEIAAHRLGQSQCGRAWAAWKEAAEKGSRPRRTLRATAARLMRPRLAATMAAWRDAWEEAGREASRTTFEQKLAAEVERRKGVEAELRRSRDELRAEREGVRRMRVAALEREQLDAMVREQDAQQRAERLMRLAARRLAQLGVSRAWNRWHGKAQAGAAQRRTLRAAASRLARPQQSAAFGGWRYDWEAAKAARREASLDQLGARRQAKIEEELRAARAEVRAERERFEAERAAVAEAARQAERAEEAALERRLAHLAGTVATRLLRLDVARAWGAWAEAAEARAAQARVLRAVGARLLRPKLAACVAAWRRDWEEGKRSGLEGSISAEARRCAELQRQLGEARADAEKQRLYLLREADRRMESALQTEADRRVDELQRLAARRLSQLGLARAFGGWAAAWEEGAAHRRTMRQVGARLLQPRLAACVAAWRRDWEQERVRAERAALAARAARSLGEQRAALDDEIARLRSELAAERDASDAARAEEWERREAAGREREEEHERRVDHLQGVAVRRLGQVGLARGWGAWLDMHVRHTRQRSALLMVAGRMLRPRVAAALGAWRRDWEAAQAAAARLAAEGAASAEAERRRSIEVEMARVQAELDAAQRLRDAEAEAARVAAADDEAAREARAAHLQDVAARRLGQMSVARAWGAWAEAAEARAAQARVLRAVGARLLRPKLAACVAAWRRDWEEAGRLQLERQRAEDDERERLRAETHARTLDQLGVERQQLALERLAAADEKAAFLERSQRLLDERQAALDEVRAEAENRRREEEAARAAADADAEKRRSQAQKQLEGLLREQRATFDAELRQKADSEEALRKSVRAMQAEIERLRRVLEALRPKEKPPPPPPKEEEPKKAKKEYGKGSVLGTIDLDEESGVPYAVQLRDALVKNAGRVIDLFREWDTDGDGEVSRKEFHKAMKQLGLEVPKKDIDELFDSWDPDGSGTLDFKELQKVLRPPPGAARPPPTLQKRASAKG